MRRGWDAAGPGAGFGASFWHLLRELALILCVVRKAPKVGPGSNWVRFIIASGGTDATLPGAGFDASFLNICVDWIRFCAGAAMIFPAPFGCLSGCKVAGRGAPAGSVVGRLLKTGEIEFNEGGDREKPAEDERRGAAMIHRFPTVESGSRAPIENRSSERVRRAVARPAASQKRCGPKPTVAGNYFRGNPSKIARSM